MKGCHLGSDLSMETVVVCFIEFWEVLLVCFVFSSPQILELNLLFYVELCDEGLCMNLCICSIKHKCMLSFVYIGVACCIAVIKPIHFHVYSSTFS